MSICKQGSQQVKRKSIPKAIKVIALGVETREQHINNAQRGHHEYHLRAEKP
jgi:ATP-dependent Zn protease